ncbi:MAG TPA: hypothetical protein VFE07_10010 [Marmoricola sp.]|nr:hypothetical protein [Marmoricola sp.]
MPRGGMLGSGLVLLVLGAVACGGPEQPTDPAARARLHETDRVAQVVSDAISYPRQDSAAGFARAANDTAAARDGRLVVIGMHELKATANEDAIARLTFRVHLTGSDAGFGNEPSITACYSVQFNRYGVMGSPTRIDCPVDADAVPVPPAPAKAQVPVGSDEVVRAALRHAARPAVQHDVEAEIVRRAGRLVTNPSTSLGPEVAVVVRGDDVAVALTGDDDCLLGRRVAGRVEVWYPPSATVEPGEYSCSADSALVGAAMAAPH